MLPLKKKTQERKTAHAPTQSEENRKTRSGIVSHGASQCTESTRSTVRVKGGKSVWQTAPPTLSAPPPTSLPLSYGFNYEGMRVRGPRHTCSATWRHPPYLRAFLTYINTQRGGGARRGAAGQRNASVSLDRESCRAELLAVLQRCRRRQRSRRLWPRPPSTSHFILLNWI